MYFNFIFSLLIRKLPPEFPHDIQSSKYSYFFKIYVQLSTIIISITGSLHIIENRTITL